MHTLTLPTNIGAIQTFPYPHKHNNGSVSKVCANNDGKDASSEMVLESSVSSRMQKGTRKQG
jgi:hypothetical protein